MNDIVLNDEQQTALQTIKEFTETIVSGEMPEGGRFMSFSGPAGCVDKDTEFLTPAGWKPIGEYNSEDLVCQWEPDGSTCFVKPSVYTKVSAEKMYRIKTKTVDMVLSPGHRVPYITSRGKFAVKSCQEILEMGEVEIPRKYKSGGEGNPLSMEYIRVLIMQAADGSIRNPRTRHVVVNVKKDTKKLRAEQLLNSAGINYHRYDCSNGFSRFYYHAPLEIPGKELDVLWSCDQRGFEVIAEEATYWDGSESQRVNVTTKRFTGTKRNADLIQHAFAVSSGCYAGISKDKRDYVNEPIYSVSQSSRCVSTIDLNSQGCVEEFIPTDGLQYCFTVPSSFWLARRNGKVFPTGNTGKTTTLIELMNQIEGLQLCATTNRAAKNLGDDVSTIFRTIGLRIELDEYTGEFCIVPTDRFGLVPNRVIAIDEASMLTVDLVKWIARAADQFQCGFVFVGDKYQLPAVGDPFDVFDGSIPMVELETIMRQKADNPIQQWGVYLRRCIKEGLYPENLITHLSEEGGITQLHRDEALSLMCKKADEGESSFAVAFTNRTTEDLNRLMRKGDFSEKPPFDDELLTVGTAIAASVVGNDGRWRKVTVATTNSLPVYEMNPWGDLSLHGVDGLGVRVMSEYDDAVTWFDGLIPVNFKQYSDTKKSLLDTAVMCQREYKEAEKSGTATSAMDKTRRKNWRDYYEFIETFFDLRPTFAGTVHKTQGCTYDNIFIDIADLSKAKHVGDGNRIEMYTRLLYVSVTRARHNVYFYS